MRKRNERNSVQFHKKLWDNFFIIEASSSRNYFLWTNVPFSRFFWNKLKLVFLLISFKTLRARKESENRVQLSPIKNKWLKIGNKQQFYLTRGSKEFMRKSSHVFEAIIVLNYLLRNWIVTWQEFFFSNFHAVRYTNFPIITLRYTLFYYKQRFFLTQPKCCLIFWSIVTSNVAYA